MFRPYARGTDPMHRDCARIDDVHEIWEVGCKVKELPLEVQNRYLLKQLNSIFEEHRTFMKSLDSRITHIETTLVQLTTPNSEYARELVDPNEERRKMAKDILELKQAIVGKSTNVS